MDITRGEVVLTDEKIKRIKALAYDLVPLDYICSDYGIVNPLEHRLFAKAVINGEGDRYRDEHNAIESFRKAVFGKYEIYKFKSQEALKVPKLRVDSSTYLLALNHWRDFKRQFMDFSFIFSLRRMRERITTAQLENASSDVRKVLVHAWSTDIYANCLEPLKAMREKIENEAVSRPH